MTSTLSRVATVVSRRALHTTTARTTSLLSGRIGAQLLSQNQIPPVAAQFFSTAAVAAIHEEEPVKKKAKSKRRRTLQAKDPIIVVRTNLDCGRLLFVVGYQSLTLFSHSFRSFRPNELQTVLRSCLEEIMPKVLLELSWE